MKKTELDEIVADYCKREHNITISAFQDFGEKLQSIIKMLALTEYLNKGWQAKNNKKKYYILYWKNECYIQLAEKNAYRNSFCYFKDETTAHKAIRILGKKTIKKAIC